MDNPTNRFEAAHVEWDEEPPPADLEVFEEETKSALARNKSPDIGFRWSLNPYRGCFHGCAYCYARPSHQYWGFGAGTDFERRITVKTNIAARLRHTFGKPRWRGEVIALSGNTDCYQPLEAHYKLTRACLQACVDYENPVAVITKGKLIRRDIDLLQKLSERAACHVSVSIPFSSDEDAKHIEPFASSPTKRFETLKLLSDAGLNTSVAVAPVIVGLNDMQIPTILERAAAAGAKGAFTIALRLPLEVAPVFESRLRAAFPLRSDKVMSAVRDVRQRRLNESRFGDRMVGHGPRWDAVRQLFETQCRRLGLQTRGTLEPPAAMTGPSRRQLPLAF